MEKPIDKAFREILEQDKQTGEMAPHLDLQLSKVEKIDAKIHWFNGKIKELEVEKQRELLKMDDLLDAAMTSKWELKNGYCVKPDNRHQIEIQDSGEFLKWLKENKEPQVILKFFKDALKVTNLKKFCDYEANMQRVKGIMKPSIGGVNIGEVTYRRLTTEYKKGKVK